MRNVRTFSALALLGLATTAHGGESVSANARHLDTGHRVYRAQCGACHGAQGEGAARWERPDGQGELPPPPHDSRGHTWKHGDGMLYRIVRDGWRDPFNKTERLTMPAFGPTLAPRDIRAVIDYLKTLWTPAQRRFQREESRRMPYPPEAR